MSESIVSAAVKVGDLIVSVPAPGRHHSVVHALSALNVSPGPDTAQGFLTSEGRFVDRREGQYVARKAEQVSELKWPPNLYSEDLW